MPTTTPATGCSLYPQINSHRDFRDLSGLWRFRVDWHDRGETDQWFARPLPADADTREVPVPASYNDLFAETAIRDHVGAVWYETDLITPASWTGLTLQLRFDAVAHHATVWLDGIELGRHKGGFLPFAFDVTTLAKTGTRHRLTVRADNRLDWSCLPGGEITTRPDGNQPGKTRLVQVTHFDFFNYSGISRPVRLLALPATHITMIDVCPRRAGGPAGTEEWKVHVQIASNRTAPARLRVRAPDGHELVAGTTHAEGTAELALHAPALWAPGHGRLHTLEVELLDASGTVTDRYDERFGCRTIEVKPDAFLINDQPFYFQGFGKHEDAETHGRGLDLAHLVHDFSLMKWIGANSARTSHYPYSEEFMRLADQQGLVIIDEMPAVGFNDFKDTPLYTEDRAGAATLAHHLDVARDLVSRDRNHPCVVMWSIGNEPASHNPGAEGYFRAVAAETRRCDPTRPLTLVEDREPGATLASQFVDVICTNRYIGWYSHLAQYDRIEPLLEADLRGWNQRFNKPVIIAEYGADTVAGLHSAVDEFFTEEYQVTTLDRHHRVFDKLPFVIGEHVWNFADFATKQGLTRIQGNKKGVFTRARHPKAAAHALRQRWRERLAHQAL
jgi:beta-glucuronidase